MQTSDQMVMNVLPQSEQKQAKARAFSVPAQAWTNRHALFWVLSAGATLLVASLVKVFAEQGSWVFQFFFCRRFVQWIIVWMCIHGLVELARRIPAWWRERRGLRNWQRGGTPGLNAGLVSDRYQRLKQLLECASVVDIRAGARRLAEQAAAQLDSRYSTVNVLTHLASYCGFFGTVLGLSVGLFQAFGSQGALSIKSFGAAVSTSFDTTLSGVACTILLIMMQSLMRSREEALLTATDQMVEDTLLQHEQEMATTLGVAGLAVSPQNHAEIYSRTVDMISGQVREMTAASQSLVQQTQTLIETFSQTNRELHSNSTKIEATHQSVEAARADFNGGLAGIAAAAKEQAHMLAQTLDQTSSELRQATTKAEATQKAVGAVQALLNDGLAQVAAAARDHSGQIATVAHQVEHFATKLADMKDIVSRPRHLQISETV
jgi:biopolymer transport protein ExbB/TolQ